MTDFFVPVRQNEGQSEILTQLLLKLSTNHFTALLCSPPMSPLALSGVMTDAEVPVTWPARVTLACLCNETLQAGGSMAPPVVELLICMHGCAPTGVIYYSALWESGRAYKHFLKPLFLRAIRKLILVLLDCIKQFDSKNVCGISYDSYYTDYCMKIKYVQTCKMITLNCLLVQVQMTFSI